MHQVHDVNHGAVGPDITLGVHVVDQGAVLLDDAGEVSDAAWADYLWFNANLKGQSREIWLHLTCMEMFVMTRDTALNATLSSDAAAEGRRVVTGARAGASGAEQAEPGWRADSS